MVETEAITQRFHLLAGVLDERARRLVAAAEALSIGRGGSIAVARATGISRRSIRQGIKELQGETGPVVGRVRREGGGRKKTVNKDPSLRDDLVRLMMPASQGDMESPLSWTCKSVRQLTEELKQVGHNTSHRLVAELLHELGFNFRTNRKVREDRDCANLDTQLGHINRTVEAYFAASEPVISVEARKKEFVGEIRNGGRNRSPQDVLEKKGAGDFLISKLSQVVPDEVYNPGQNYDSINIEVNHDIEAFTVEGIQHWWNATGRVAYAQARRLLITIDGNGSYTFRTHILNLEVQKLADETGLAITVCHRPPCTSKWNKIEYQFIAFVLQNWGGRSLISHEVIIKLIMHTTTPVGRSLQCHLDANSHPLGPGESVADTAPVSLRQDVCHDKWNYTIFPHSVSQ
jgi:transposase